jgi:hypothetical protein
MTDIATNLSTIDGSLSDIKTAIVAKGVTPSGNITTYATAIGQISGGGGSGKYQLLERVKDDSNNEIGTVSGFFTDANDVEYAVVCLDAQYRNSSTYWCSDNSSAITNMPEYSNLVTSNVWTSQETATENTQLILDYCSANSASSTACSHCRSKSFMIDGTTYYGQLPNIIELAEIAKHYNAIETADTTSSSYTSTNFSSGHYIWSSTQCDGFMGWYIGNTCPLQFDDKTGTFFACPILEIPNN